MENVLSPVIVARIATSGLHLNIRKKYLKNEIELESTAGGFIDVRQIAGTGKTKNMLSWGY